MTGLVRTVLGDRPGPSLGRVNYHEHLFQVSPLLPGDELTDEALSGAEAALLRRSGTTTMVDATPVGLGRNPAALARISAGTGLQIVATTGAHREEHYGVGHWITELAEVELAERFVRELVDGLPEVDELRRGQPVGGLDGVQVRAGVLKAGLGYWRISPFERRVLAAVGAAHRAVGAPIMVHLEHGTAAFEVLAVLAEEGVGAAAVALAHVDRNPDPGLHAELAAAGAYLGYDGFARSRNWPDSVIIDCLCATAEQGGAGHILIGGDVARRTRYVAYGGLPGLAYVDERILPRLARAGGSALVDAVTHDNPTAWLGRFAAEPPDPH